MGGAQTRQITLANLDKFSHIGLFSGGSIAANDPALADPAAFRQKVKVLFVSYGSKENTAAAKANKVVVVGSTDPLIGAVSTAKRPTTVAANIQLPPLTIIGERPIRVR